MVRTIQAEQITQEVAQMCKEAAYYYQEMFLPLLKEVDLAKNLLLDEKFSTKLLLMQKLQKKKTDLFAKILV